MDNQAKRLKRDYVALVEAVSTVIDRADPIGLLAGGAPLDGSTPEIGTILPLLKTAEGPEEVQKIVHEEFMRWFGSDIAGPQDAYHQTGLDVWHVLEAFRRREERPDSGSQRP